MYKVGEPFPPAEESTPSFIPRNPSPTLRQRNIVSGKKRSKKKKKPSSKKKKLQYSYGRRNFIGIPRSQFVPTMGKRDRRPHSARQRRKFKEDKDKRHIVELRSRLAEYKLNNLRLERELQHKNRGNDRSPVSHQLWKDVTVMRNMIVEKDQIIQSYEHDSDLKTAIESLQSLRHNFNATNKADPESVGSQLSGIISLLEDSHHSHSPRSDLFQNSSRQMMSQSSTMVVSPKSTASAPVGIPQELHITPSISYEDLNHEENKHHGSDDQLDILIGKLQKAKEAQSKLEEDLKEISERERNARLEVEEKTQELQAKESAIRSALERSHMFEEKFLTMEEKEQELKHKVEMLSKANEALSADDESLEKLSNSQLAELEQVKEAMMAKDRALKEKQRELTDKTDELRAKERSLKEKQVVIEEKDRILREKQNLILKVEEEREMVRKTYEVEIQVLKKDAAKASETVRKELQEQIEKIKKERDLNAKDLDTQKRILDQKENIIRELEKSTKRLLKQQREVKALKLEKADHSREVERLKEELVEHQKMLNASGKIQGHEEKASESWELAENPWSRASETSTYDMQLKVGIDIEVCCEGWQQYYAGSLTKFGDDMYRVNFPDGEEIVFQPTYVHRNKKHWIGQIKPAAGAKCLALRKEYNQFVLGRVLAVHDNMVKVCYDEDDAEETGISLDSGVIPLKVHIRLQGARGDVFKRRFRLYETVYFRLSGGTGFSLGYIKSVYLNNIQVVYDVFSHKSKKIIKRVEEDCLCKLNQFRGSHKNLLNVGDSVTLMGPQFNTKKVGYVEGSFPNGIYSIFLEDTSEVLTHVQEKDLYYNEKSPRIDNFEKGKCAQVYISSKKAFEVAIVLNIHDDESYGLYDVKLSTAKKIMHRVPHWRMKHISELESHKLVLEEDLEKKATAIQARFRGFLARKKIDHNGSANRRLRSNSTDKKEELKARLIQSHYRGYITRKKIKQQQKHAEREQEIEKARTIQAHFRGHNVRTNTPQKEEKKSSAEEKKLYHGDAKDDAAITPVQGVENKVRDTTIETKEKIDNTDEKIGKESSSNDSIEEKKATTTDDLPPITDTLLTPPSEPQTLKDEEKKTEERAIAIQSQYRAYNARKVRAEKALRAVNKKNSQNPELVAMRQRHNAGCLFAESSRNGPLL